MRTAKELVKIFSEMNPDEPVWCWWIDRSEIIDTINNYEHTDEEGNLIEVDESVVTEDFFKSIMNSVDNAEYVWERFNEELSDTIHEKYDDYLTALAGAKEDEGLWDKEEALEQQQRETE